MHALIIAKLVGCGGCERFNLLHRDDLLEELEDEARIQIIEMTFGTSGENGIEVTDARTGKSYTGKLNPNIRDDIAWFPTFILVSSEHLSSSGPTHGAIFNSRVVDGAMEPAGKPLTASSIAMWVQDELDHSAQSQARKRRPGDDTSGYHCDKGLMCRRNSKITDYI